MTSHSDDDDTGEMITPEQEKAIRLILDAKLETDEDYINLAKLIDDEISADSARLDGRPPADV